MSKRVYGGWKPAYPSKRGKYNPKPKGYNNKLRASVSAGSGSTAKKIKTLVRALNKQAPEIKYADLAFNFSSIATPGSITPLISIAQGDDINNRSGDVINLKHLTLRMFVSRATTAALTTADAYVRAFIVKDTQGVADTAPTVADIFTQVSPIAFLNLDNRSRFSVVWRSQLFDLWKMACDADGQPGLGVPTQNGVMECDIDVTGLVQYNGSTATDYQRNMHYLVLLTNLPGTGLDSTINGYTRVMFTDP